VAGGVRRGIAAATLGLLLAGCATFPDQGPREWRAKPDGQGELGGPPVVPETQPPAVPPRADGAPQRGPQVPSGCVDPDPQVVATCLEPVGAIAVLPDGASALVGERTTGRVLRVSRGEQPELVTTLPVDPAGGGGLTGLALSPAFAEDQLAYAYTTTAEDNRVVRIAPGDVPKPVFTGIPRGASHNGGALGIDPDGALLVATGDAGDPAAAPGPSLAGKVLRIDTLGRPATGNPDPASPVLSSGLRAPGGVCTDPLGASTWITDRAGDRDVLHRLAPGPLPAPAWTWPERPGVAGCTAQPGVVLVAETGGAAIFVLRSTETGTFIGEPETLLPDVYGRLSATAPGPDGLLWVGTVNKAPGGSPAPSDDRVIRIQPPAGGGESRA
jgi:glucose/arabinose dehydrogenase